MPFAEENSVKLDLIAKPGYRILLDHNCDLLSNDTIKLFSFGELKSFCDDLIARSIDTNTSTCAHDDSSSVAIYNVITNLVDFSSDQLENSTFVVKYDRSAKTIEIVIV